MLFGRKKPGFIEEQQVLGGEIREGVSGSIDKNGVITVDAKDADAVGLGVVPSGAELDGGVTAIVADGKEAAASAASENGEKPDLLAYLESQPDVEDPFADIAAAEQEAQEEPEQTRAQQFAEFIRVRSAAGELTAYKKLKAEDENLDELLAELAEDESCQDIKTIEGSKDVYYYSVNRMSNNYAMIAMYVEEKDLVVTIAQMVRFNCKTYPTPTPLTYFENHPYFYTKPQIERAISLLETKEEYRDIHRLTNSEGKDYLYSDLTMTEVYAKALIKPDEFTA